MKIQDFEKELKAIHQDFRIQVAPNNPEMAGIYWGQLYVCGIPSGDIFDEVKKDYKNSAGIVHRTRPVALAQVKQYLWRINHESGFYEDEQSFLSEKHT